MTCTTTTTHRRAVIDVGTNSVKLLVADVNGRQVVPVVELSEQTRLGNGFFETNQLQPAAIAMTAKAVAHFAASARATGVSLPRIIATSAARDALNQGELTQAIKEATGLKLEIISGDQEADWVFKGVTNVPGLENAPLLLLDVGGGSTEFIVGRGTQKHFRESFQLGAVRLMEKIPVSDPPGPGQLTECRNWVRDFLKLEVLPRMGPPLAAERTAAPASQPLELIGTGGTATILARMEAQLDDYDRERIEATRLTRDRVRWQVEALWSVPLAERKRFVGLPKKRADIILYGSVIYEVLMELLGFAELRISTRGLRFAAVMDEG